MLSSELLGQHQTYGSLAGILGGKNVGTPYPTGCVYDFPTSSEGKFPHIVASEKKRQYTPHRNRNIGLFQKGGACHGSTILRSPSESPTIDDSASPLDTQPIGPGNRHVKKLGRQMEKTLVRCALR